MAPPEPDGEPPDPPPLPGDTIHTIPSSPSLCSNLQQPETSFGLSYLQNSASSTKAMTPLESSVNPFISSQPNLSFDDPSLASLPSEKANSDLLAKPVTSFGKNPSPSIGADSLARNLSTKTKNKSPSSGENQPMEGRKTDLQCAEILATTIHGDDYQMARSDRESQLKNSLAKSSELAMNLKKKNSFKISDSEEEEGIFTGVRHVDVWFTTLSDCVSQLDNNLAGSTNPAFGLMKMIVLFEVYSSLEKFGLHTLVKKRLALVALFSLDTLKTIFMTFNFDQIGISIIKGKRKSPPHVTILKRDVDTYSSPNEHRPSRVVSPLESIDKERHTVTSRCSSTVHKLLLQGKDSSFTMEAKHIDDGPFQDISNVDTCLQINSDFVPGLETESNTWIKALTGETTKVTSQVVSEEKVHISPSRYNALKEDNNIQVEAPALRQSIPRTKKDQHKFISLGKPHAGTRSKKSNFRQ